LEQVKQETEQLNSLRKEEQLACGNRLAQLEAKRLALINKNLQIELACQQLQQQQKS
jgi:hypothetical protein